ncbi:MAG: hypothetical protein M1835_004417 [Candelina submexicana]|nr:MAG: hypothetical protein M1835_004417 [Candelina submexicana]
MRRPLEPPFLTITLLLPLLTGATTILNPPSCEDWLGSPKYSKCNQALQSFVTAVTSNRNYALDERIEFRASTAAPRHANLPSELLVPDLNTFTSNDINGVLQDDDCVIAFGMTYTHAHLDTANFISSYGELHAAASSVIETCVRSDGPHRITGGTASLSSTEEAEQGIKIGPTVYNVVSSHSYDLITAVRQSQLYKGERNMDGAPWQGGQMDLFGSSGSGNLQGEGIGQKRKWAEEGTYCNVDAEQSCWPGFTCGVLKFADKVMGVVWGLEMGRAAGFIGSCALDGGTG